MRLRALTACLSMALLTACAARRSTVPGGSAVFRIEQQNGTYVLIPPSTATIVAKPVPFSEILHEQYGYNPWEQYVNLAPDMRLRIQRMTLGQQVQSSDFVYDVTGRVNSLRLRSGPNPDATLGAGVRGKNFRLFYQTKYTKAPDQPTRSAILIWGEGVGARTSAARENPHYACGERPRDCTEFTGPTSVTPEIRIVVNEKPRYVFLGATLREVLRADRVASPADLRLSRIYRRGLTPVEWKNPADALWLPLVAGDTISWGQP